MNQGSKRPAKDTHERAGYIPAGRGCPCQEPFAHLRSGEVVVCSWYGDGMSTQMTVRIPDDLATFVDNQVAAGAVASRAEAIAVALRHEQRRLAAQRDAAIYAAAGSDTDMNALAAWTAEQPMDVA